MNTTHPTSPRNRDNPAQDTLYRQVFASPVSSLTIAIPQSWRGQMIEVIAFPVNGMLDAPNPAKIVENRKKREENSRKYAVSFKSLGYVFNRGEANEYDE